mgnify:CR=1 FL=1
MPKFIFAYHGGKAPETPEEGEKVMAQWRAWFESLGSAVVDPGHPLGMSKTVSSSGVTDDGGANPISGFSLINAADIDKAAEMAKGCPMLSDGGSVEIAEAFDM